MNAFRFLFIASASAATAVAFGAFGAHGLKSHVTADLLAVWQTAVQYHFWHALGLGLIAGVRYALPRTPLPIVAGYAFIGGTLLFSGSLYLLVLSGQRWLGMVTPIGGVAFLVGWCVLAWLAWREGRSVSA